jgi:purine-nucleoside phosphorylase
MILNVDIHTNYIYRLIIYFEMEGVIKEGTTGAVASE